MLPSFSFGILCTKTIGPYHMQKPPLLLPLCCLALYFHCGYQSKLVALHCNIQTHTNAFSSIRKPSPYQEIEVGNELQLPSPSVLITNTEVGKSWASSQKKLGTFWYGLTWQNTRRTVLHWSSKTRLLRKRITLVSAATILLLIHIRELDWPVNYQNKGRKRAVRGIRHFPPQSVQVEYAINSINSEKSW